MSYSVQPGNIAGRIGTGFAKGLSEQVPKEIERHRLSSGLKKLGQQDLSGMNRLEQLGELHNIPGVSENPELARQAMMQIQGQALRKKANESAGGTSALNTSQMQGQPLQKGNISEAGLASQADINAYKQNLKQEPLDNEVKSLAADYFDQGLAQSPNEALTMARQELAQNLTSQNNKIEKFRKGLEGRMTKDLQKEGFAKFNDVTGNMINKLTDQGEYLIANGMTPEVAEKKISDISTELAKSTNKLKESGDFWNRFKHSSDKTSLLRQQKKIFDKYGFGEEFNDMASSSLGITRLQAASVLDPLENKEIKKEIGSIYRGLPLGLSNKKFDKIAESIKPTDNVLSIAHAIRKNHMNVENFLKRVRTLADEGKIALTDRQKREIQSPENNSLLGDILYETF